MLAAQVELLPGGRAGRIGGIALLQTSQRGGRGLAALGVIYEAAASRPRLWLELHAELGACWDDARVSGGGGVITHLALWGLVGMVVDTGLRAVYAGTDTEVVLSTTLLLVIAH